MMGLPMLQPFHWLVLFIILLVIELLTMGLTTIWFAGGSLAAMTANLLGSDFWTQIIVFLAVSFVLLIFTRPFAAKYINRGFIRTNADELIGTEAIVLESIDNLHDAGKIRIKGVEWTARSKDPKKTIEKGCKVEILAIEGVKLIVKEKEKV